ncbi:hypothetical protein [Bradyrhizobium australiense]|uniref:Uncharacterized protein n=1 Tax=Bradyrhizobium australiense TaxID=2721161 RepID=A0A7Y4LW47_9BRAD|nr:hypothetical protein [Bradyrhizobium australiense]NOJ40801.1 hypothetical protein [Bradyrhizobium australiense]
MSFKVIDGGGPDKEERDRERERDWAKHELSGALREVAANMVRIVRGAGKPHELLIQMKAVIDSAIKFRDLHGYWPNDVIANALQLTDEMQDCLDRGRAGTLDQAHIDRWWKDGTFDKMMAEHTMYKGVLQIVASGLIGQNTQQRAGESEFHDGLRRFERIREEQLRRFTENRSTSRPTPKRRKLRPRKPPEDVVL